MPNLGDLIQSIDRNVFLCFGTPWTGEEIQVEARVVRCASTDKGI